MTTFQRSFMKGALWMLLSGSFLSLSFLAVKWSGVTVPFVFLVFARFAIALILFFLYLLFVGKVKRAVLTKNLHFHIARGAAIVGTQYCLYYYILKNKILNATLFLNIAPMFIPVIEWAFLKHKIGKSTIIALAVSFVGVLFILHPSSDIFQWINLIGLSASILWAIGQTIYGLNVHAEPLETSVFYLFLIGTILTIPALFFDPPSQAIFQGAMPLVIFMMALFTLVNQYARGLAYKHGKPSTMSVFIYISIVLSALIDWTIFHIIPPLWTIIGALLIILGGVLKVVLRHHFLKRK